MLETLLSVFFWFVIIIGGTIILGFFWQWFYGASTSQDETIYFRTEDGWRLALHRYCLRDHAVGLPVVLCHGLSANRYVFEIPGAPSLADFLRKNGRDVWVAELRGSGMSERPGFRHSDVPYSWDFEDHLRHDVPAIIDCVLTRTGASRVHWVGHSMGGLLILAHLASHSNSQVASAITLGSHTDFSSMDSGIFEPLLKLRWLLKRLPISPLPFLGKMFTPLAPWVPSLLLGTFNPNNIAPTAARKIVALAAEPVSPTELWLDFGRFLETGVFGPENGTPYLTGLNRSNVPIFLMGGSKDRMAPPEAVNADCEEIEKCMERKHLILGKNSGFVEDYGHMDLLVGIRAMTEVFPSILAWLERHEDPGLEQEESELPATPV